MLKSPVDPHLCIKQLPERALPRPSQRRPLPALLLLTPLLLLRRLRRRG